MVCPAKTAVTPLPFRYPDATSILPSCLPKQGPIRRGFSVLAMGVDPGRRWLWVAACAGTTTDSCSRGGALRGELRRLMFRRQRIDQFAHPFTCHHLRKLIECQVDAVIGDAAL